MVDNVVTELLVEAEALVAAPALAELVALFADAATSLVGAPKLGLMAGILVTGVVGVEVVFETVAMVFTLNLLD